MIFSMSGIVDASAEGKAYTPLRMRIILPLLHAFTKRIYSALLVELASIISFFLFSMTLL